MIEASRRRPMKLTTRRRVLRASMRAILVAACVLAAAPASAHAQRSPSSVSHLRQQAKYAVTLFGWPDNDPPGDGIAYPQIHDRAGGTGTYDDPVTFAAPY